MNISLEFRACARNAEAFIALIRVGAYHVACVLCLATLGCYLSSDRSRVRASDEADVLGRRLNVYTTARVALIVHSLESGGTNMVKWIFGFVFMFTTLESVSAKADEIEASSVTEIRNVAHATGSFNWKALDHVLRGCSLASAQSILGSSGLQFETVGERTTYYWFDGIHLVVIDFGPTGAHEITGLWPLEEN